MHHTYHLTRGPSTSSLVGPLQLSVCLSNHTNLNGLCTSLACRYTFYNLVFPAKSKMGAITVEPVNTAFYFSNAIINVNVRDLSEMGSTVSSYKSDIKFTCLLAFIWSILRQSSESFDSSSFVEEFIDHTRAERCLNSYCFI
jgi:hypothetical protein